MSLTRYFAALRLNFTIRLRSIWLQAMLLVMPLLMIPFLQPTYKDSLRAQGYANANGAEQAVPGLALLFTVMSLQVVLQLFFDEHTWHTWDRLRASACTMLDIVAAKFTIAFLIQIIQLGVVMLLGGAIFGYHPNGSILALVCVCLLFSAALTVLALSFYAVCPDESSALSISDMICMVLASIGGTLGPISSYPSWAQHAAKCSPFYWAMHAINSISLDHAGMADIMGDMGWLAVFLVAFIALAAILLKVAPKRKN